MDFHTAIAKMFFFSVYYSIKKMFNILKFVSSLDQNFDCDIDLSKFSDCKSVELCASHDVIKVIIQSVNINRVNSIFVSPTNRSVLD